MLVYSTDKKIQKSIKACGGDVYVDGPKKRGLFAGTPDEYFEGDHFEQACENAWALNPVTGLCPECGDEEGQSWVNGRRVIWIE